MAGVIYRSEIPVILTAIFAVVMITNFFVDAPPLASFAAESQRMFVPIVSFAGIVGGVNLLLYHTYGIKKRSKEWELSVVLIVTYVFFFIITLAPGLESFYSDMYTMIIGRLYEATWALIAPFMVTMAYRAFRIRTFETFLFTLGCLLILLGNAPVGEVIWPQATGVLGWLMDVPTMAGMRAITIGVGLGVIAYGIRVMLGYDRAALGEF